MQKKKERFNFVKKGLLSVLTSDWLNFYLYTYSERVNNYSVNFDYNTSLLSVTNQ